MDLGLRPSLATLVQYAALRGPLCLTRFVHSVTLTNDKFMSTLNIYAKYRPVRIGWCIREGSWDDLRKVLRLTHTLWGGRYNPIIVLGNDAVEKQLIEAFQVDCLYAAHEDGQFKKLKERFPYLPWPIYPDLFSGDSQEEKRANFLDVYHPIRLLYDEYIKANTNPKLSATYFEWDTTDRMGRRIPGKFWCISVQGRYGH